MNVILLYYKYVSIEDPQLIAKWQNDLCTALHLTGRIIIAHEGINGTLGGNREAMNSYITQMRDHPLFGGIDFKISEGSGKDFPRLSIKIRPEIVRLDIDSEQLTVAQGGKHLTPAQTHEKISQDKDIVILDARNIYEARIGAFNNAITPDIKSFRELPLFIDNNLELFKDKEVLMYCTGGVRCERASAYLKTKNVAREVYQIEGGIHRYIEQFPDGHFRGKNFVFDARLTVNANADIISTCDRCETKYDTYSHCANIVCQKRLLMLCPPCSQATLNTCGDACREKVAAHSWHVTSSKESVHCE